MRYIDLIRAIKTQPDGLLMYSFTDDIERIVSRLQLVRCINLHWEIDEQGRHGRRLTIAPKTPEIEVQDVIQASHWRTGAQNGLFAQQKHVVVSRETIFGYEWVRYRDTTGNLHTVKAEYTRSVA